MSIARAWMSSLALALVACGGTVVFEEGSSGDGGGGNGGGAVGSTTSNGSGSPTVSTATGSGAGSGTSSIATGTGSANGGGSSVSTSSGVVSVTVGPGSGGGSACSSLNYADCLGSADRCVPQFDDFCCPSCFPGECADCIDYRSVGCIDRETGGDPGGDGDDGTPPPGPPPPQCAFPGCGFVPDWACNGDKPSCENGCFAAAGCVEKIQCVGDGCSVICDAVAPDACGPVNCNAPPPVCGDGQIAEAAAGCWTGNCIPLWVCQYNEL